MEEIRNDYLTPTVVQDKGQWGIELKKVTGLSSSFHPFSTEKDARDALVFARLMQYMGIALRVDRKIMVKKSN